MRIPKVCIVSGVIPRNIQGVNPFGLSDYVWKSVTMYRTICTTTLIKVKEQTLKLGQNVFVHILPQCSCLGCLSEEDQKAFGRCT